MKRAKAACLLVLQGKTHAEIAREAFFESCRGGRRVCQTLKRKKPRNPLGRGALQKIRPYDAELKR